MRRAYRLLLRLYPYDYRYAFAAEMRAAFESARVEHRAAAGYARFAAAELASLLTGAVVEWRAKLASGRVRRRSLPDLRLMRPAEIHGSVWFARVKGNGDARGF